MKRLVFIVEGITEVSFVEKKIIPYLYSLGFKNGMNAQTIITNRKLNKKGGVINYELLKNDILRVFAQENVIVTTLIDFFRLPTNFPRYTKDSNLIKEIEKGISNEIGQGSNFIPYIQKYELESLMFSGIEGFKIVIDEERGMQEIKDILMIYENPEDINGSSEGAPSKRLERIYSYDKVVDSEMIFEMLDIKQIKFKNPRFNNWINSIEKRLKDD